MRIRTVCFTAVMLLAAGVPASAQDVRIPRGPAIAGGALGAGVVAAKGGRFCLRHPLLCSAGLVTGLAVGGVAIAQAKRRQELAPCAGAAGCQR